MRTLQESWPVLFTAAGPGGSLAITSLPGGALALGDPRPSPHSGGTGVAPSLLVPFCGGFHIPPPASPPRFGHLLRNLPLGARGQTSVQRGIFPGGVSDSAFPPSRSFERQRRVEGPSPPGATRCSSLFPPLRAHVEPFQRPFQAHPQELCSFPFPLKPFSGLLAPSPSSSRAAPSSFQHDLRDGAAENFPRQQRTRPASPERAVRGQAA